MNHCRGVETERTFVVILSAAKDPSAPRRSLSPRRTGVLRRCAPQDDICSGRAMLTNRRDFLKTSALAAGVLAVPNLAFAEKGNVEPAKKALSILILGGTGFTGPEQVEYALARGHADTLSHRNKTRPDFFKGNVDQLLGDLHDDMSEPKERAFDVVTEHPTT